MKGRQETLGIVAVLALAASGTAVSAQSSGQGANAQSGASVGVQASAGGIETRGSASAGTNSSLSSGSQQSSLAAGTAVNAELSDSLDSKKVKTGDEVTARTTEAVKADGKTVLPRGTKLVGHITRASARSKGDAESMLAIRFDRAILKKGQELPVALSIEALAAGQGATPVGGDDLEAMSNSGAGASSSRGTMGGAAGAAGGVAGGAAGTAARTTQSAGKAAGSTANGAADAATHANAGATGGLNSAGQLTAGSRGVFGLSGVNLDATTASSAQGSVITSAGKNVHLDSGTRMLLVARAETSASAQK